MKILLLILLVNGKPHDAKIIETPADAAVEIFSLNRLDQRIKGQTEWSGRLFEAKYDKTLKLGKELYMPSVTVGVQ